MSTLDQIPQNTNSIYSTTIKIIVDLLIIFGPPVCYYSQALKFKTTKSSKGFSKILCLLLLLTNILRIYFWLGKPFSISLFYQSFLIIMSQFYLIHIYLQYQEKQKNDLSKKTLLENITNWKDIFNLSKIWDYDYEIDYYKFIFLFVSILTLACYIIGLKNTKFYEFVGVLSVSIETFIGIPQIKENCVLKNAKNLSVAMIFMWLIGDIFKAIYNFIYKNPIQIILGSLFQICEDLILILQILFYGGIGPLYATFKKNYKYLNSDENQGNENNINDNDIDSLKEDIIDLNNENNLENKNDKNENLNNSKRKTNDLDKYNSKANEIIEL